MPRVFGLGNHTRYAVPAPCVGSGEVGAVAVVDNAPRVHIVGRTLNLFLVHYPRYLYRAFALDGEGEKAAYNGGGFGVDYPFCFVVRVKGISVYWGERQPLAAHAPRLVACLYLAACVAEIPLAHDV